MKEQRIFWSILRAARERKGLGLREAARRIGIAGPTLSQHESGRSGVGEDTLIKIASAYGLTLKELLLQGLQEKEEPHQK